MEMNVKIKNNWENNKKKKRIDKIYSLFFFYFFFISFLLLNFIYSYLEFSIYFSEIMLIINIFIW